MRTTKHVDEETKREQLRRSLSSDTIWYAACEDGHPFWSGPDEKTYDAAQTDATAHDKSVHNAVPTAVVLST